MNLRRHVQRLEDAVRPEENRTEPDYTRLTDDELEDLRRIGEKIEGGVELTPAEVERARELLQKARCRAV